MSDNPKKKKSDNSKHELPPREAKMVDSSDRTLAGTLMDLDQELLDKPEDKSRAGQTEV